MHQRRLAVRLRREVAATGSAQSVGLTTPQQAALGDGPISVSAYTSYSGNTSTLNYANFTLDTHAPSQPVLSSASSQGAITATGDAGTTLTVTYSGNGGTVEKTFTASGNADSVTLTTDQQTTLSQGTGAVTITATATDLAGNVSTPNVESFRLNALPLT